ncbi:MAG: hypothetical protein B6245_14385 [Desulfobacteraceae bacterium 4572_88]|nr:MAG: hypothetical protein B6245_14385 [Desulfobacteraceae bacterium 4572_88]
MKSSACGGDPYLWSVNIKFGESMRKNKKHMAETLTMAISGRAESEAHIFSEPVGEQNPDDPVRLAE